MVVEPYQFFCPSHKKANKAAKDKRGRGTPRGKATHRRADAKYYAVHREEILLRAKFRYRRKRFLIVNKLITTP